jgi:hypothetical protein
MRQALKPILFDDHDKASADAARTSTLKATSSVFCWDAPLRSDNQKGNQRKSP